MLPDELDVTEMLLRRTPQPLKQAMQAVDERCRTKNCRHGGRGTSHPPTANLNQRDDAYRPATGILRVALTSVSPMAERRPYWTVFISTRMPCTVVFEALKTRPAGCGAMFTTKHPLPSHALSAFMASRFGGSCVPSGAKSCTGGSTWSNTKTDGHR